MVSLMAVFPVILFMCLIAMLAINIDKVWHAQRYEVTKQMKDELGLIYPLRNHMLAHRINHMIDGMAGARSDNVFGLKIGQQTVVLGDYIHVRHESEHDASIRHSVIAISLDLYEDVPPFALRRDDFFDSYSEEIGLLAVNGSGERSGEPLLSISAPVKFHEALWLFFDARPELISFCLRYNRYRLVCDGRCMVFYRPYHVIELSVDAYARQVLLARDLFDGLSLPIDAQPSEHDEAAYIKSLKDSE